MVYVSKNPQFQMMRSTLSVQNVNYGYMFVVHKMKFVKHAAKSCYDINVFQKVYLLHLIPVK